jgi:hypothetical protein
MIVTWSLLACSGMPSVDAAPPTPILTVDGLERVAIPARGVLDLRPDHGIGRCAAFLLPEVSVSYKRRSPRLTQPAERVFVNLLRQSLVEAASAAEVPIEHAPGPCVMEINISVVSVDLDVSERSRELADMTLVMEFRDSSSREPLLRYATENRVKHAREGDSRNKQLQHGFDRIIEEMNITVPLRESGLANNPLDPACNGTLAAIGRAAVQQRRD